MGDLISTIIGAIFGFIFLAAAFLLVNWPWIGLFIVLPAWLGLKLGKMLAEQ